MATSPFGNFADLTPYRGGLGGEAVNPLETLITGFTQGQAIRNLPEALQTQRQMQLEQELTRRINNSILLEKLKDLQNPQAALDRDLSRDVQKALALKSADITSGVVSMPAGLAGETIGLPGALSPEQQIALEAGGYVPTAAPVGVPITPISLGATPTGFGQDISGATAATEAIAGAKGSSALERLILGNEARRLAKEEDLASRERIAEKGTASKERIAAMKGGAKGITETSKASILGRAGKSGLIVSDADLEKFRNEAGEIDYGKLALASGRAERNELDRAREAKLESVPAASKAKAQAFQAVQLDLQRLREALDDELRTGDIPGGMQDVISASLAEEPKGFFSRMVNRFVLQPAQSDTAALNSRLKAAVASSIGRAQSGTALTATEKQNLIPFLPQQNDSFQRSLEKAAGLEEFLKNQIEGFTNPIAPNISAPASTAPKIIKITPRAQ